MNKCAFCGGKTKKMLVYFDYRDGNKIFSVASVPAEVCISCGEKTFAPAVVEAILKIIKEQKVLPKTCVNVPVWDLKNTPFFREFVERYHYV